MPIKTFLIALFIAAFPIKGVLAAEIVEVPFDALPDRVKTTVLLYTNRQAVSKISKISDENHVRFEIETDKPENNKDIISLDIVIADNGKIIKLVKEVPYFTLSYQQMQAIEKRYPGIKVNEAESVDVHYFDVVGDMSGQPVKFRLHEDGTIDEQTKP